MTMSILILMAALSLAEPGGGPLQEVPAPDPGAKWKFDLKLTLEERDGEHVFVIAGTTDVSSSALLRARVYAVESVEDFRQGRREDEEPLVWEGDEEAGQPAFQNFKAAEGTFRVEVYRFRRKPWSIRYRGRVHYYPKLQDDEKILKKVGGEEFSRYADLRVGTLQAYTGELGERVQEVTGDLQLIEMLYNELRKAFEAQGEKRDLAAWKAWKDPWYAKVEKVAERNRERFGMWAVWMERQAKMRIGGMCELLRQILVVCTEHLEGDAEALARARSRMDGFYVYFEEAIEVIGINAPLDLEKVGPAMADYERGFEPLRAWVGTRTGEGGEVAREARRKCGQALFRITPHIQTRKRAYQYVSEIAARLARLVELAREKADDASLRKALEEHDAAMADFRKFAGLAPGLMR
jgi:hypothetical protein